MAQYSERRRGPRGQYRKFFEQYGKESLKYVGYLKDIGALSFSYTTCGFWGASVFAGYKIASLTGLMDLGRWGYNTVRDAVITVDAMQESLQMLRESHDAGDLDWVYVCGLLLFASVCYHAMKGRSDNAAKNGSHSPPLSPREGGTDASDAESEEDIDPRLKSVIEGQRDMMATLQRLTARLDAPPAASEAGRSTSYSVPTTPPQRCSPPSPAPFVSLDADPVLAAGVEGLLARLTASEDTVAVDKGTTAATAGSLFLGVHCELSSPLRDVIDTEGLFRPH